MRNLILFIQQYNSFFVFLLLEIICFIIIFRNNTFQQASYINSSRKISGGLYAQKHKMTQYLGLRELNDSLAKDNARLKSLLAVQLTPNPLSDTSTIQVQKTDSTTKTTTYKYIPAKVLNNSIDQKINYVTLNVGAAEGIRRNMAVVNDRGIVGKISHVSQHYSVALSALSDKFVVSAMLGDGTVGKISWDGKDPEFVTLSGIPQSVKVKPLDSVFTSGYGIFPEKVFIGRAAKSNQGTSYRVWLSTLFSNLHYVYVIAENIDIERIQLEEKVKEEEDPK